MNTENEKLCQAALTFLLQWKHGSISTDKLDAIAGKILSQARELKTPSLSLEELETYET